jgi:hypothetical protein
MNNRIEDFLPVRDSGADLRDVDVPQPGAPDKYMSLVKQWATRHPVPCLAAAFAVGVAVAWIIKRK